MNIEIHPIGYVETEDSKVPRHWSVSDREGRLVVDEAYAGGLSDVKPGQRIVVIFYFHGSPRFESIYLKQKPPHRDHTIGVFSTCSPIRPNRVGMSVVEVIDIKGNVLRVRGIDMINGTPILDIKPFIGDRMDCPSNDGHRRPGTP